VLPSHKHRLFASAMLASRQWLPSDYPRSLRCRRYLSRHDRPQAVAV